MTYTLRVGSLEYEGKNHKAATEKALEHLGRLFSEQESLWAPVVVGPLVDSTGTYVGVAYKDTTGFWVYRIHWPDTGPGCVTSSNWSRQEALNAMCRHLAQAVFSVNFPDRCFDVLQDGDTEGLADLKRWVALQLEHARLRATGLDDWEAHQKASGT